MALLLLKGLGHREAASVLDRSERTMRQHAVSVYRKSGLAGRAELAAFFLEDLLLPMDHKGEHEQESEFEGEDMAAADIVARAAVHVAARR